MKEEKSIDWRKFVARAALVLLAGSAAYGVYAFSELFTPWPIAALTAISFEACYVGLACLSELTEQQKIVANRIAVWAVIVSIIYNSIAAVAHLSSKSFVNLDITAVWGLAIMHGLPLALTGYFLSNLLLHSDNPVGKEIEPSLDNHTLPETDKSEAVSYSIPDKELPAGEPTEIAALLAETEPIQVEQKTCAAEGCGEMARPRGKYCSDTCRQKAFRAAKSA
jgi:hypothetical protein